MFLSVDMEIVTPFSIPSVSCTSCASGCTWPLQCVNISTSIGFLKVWLIQKSVPLEYILLEWVHDRWVSSGKTTLTYLPCLFCPNQGPKFIPTIYIVFVIFTVFEKVQVGQSPFALQGRIQGAHRTRRAPPLKYEKIWFLLA